MHKYSPPADTINVAAKASRQHDDGRRRYLSFPGLLAHLGTLTGNELSSRHARRRSRSSQLTSRQRPAFDLIGALLPLTLRN